MVAWEWNAATDEVIYSDSVRGVLGLSVAEGARTHQEFLAMVHPDDRERVRHALEQALHDDGRYDETYRFVKSDGSVIQVVDTGYRVRERSDRPPRMAGVLRDAGPEVNRERKLQERVDELAEIDRRKNEFLALLGHELRNPLAAIVNGVQVLDLADNRQEEASAVRESILRQARHMTHLIDELLDASRIDRGKITLRCERLDLVSLLQQVADDIRPIIEDSRCTLEVQRPETSIWVDADATRLAQVFGNLLHNAAKFTNAGGRIVLAVQHAPGEEVATIAIRDTGIGMSRDTLERLFVPFSQAERTRDRSRGGLGLGLALVKGLVELHGGTVDAHSEGLGRGSEFRVRLPLSVKQPRPTVSRGKNEPERAATKYRVLVVEDTSAVAKLFALMLQQLGHEVEIAQSGRDALKRLHDYTPEIIFSDISMPGMSGYDLARHMRKTSAFDEITLVAMTGFGQPEDRDCALDAGFDYHLVKPADFESLQRLFQMIASRRTGRRADLIRTRPKPEN